MNVLTPTPRLADHPVDPMFVNRFSPRSFTDAPMAEGELMILLEAARWAPSAANVQPTRLAWGLRGSEDFARIAGLLAPGNRPWAEKAAALVVVASKTFVERDGARQIHASAAFDAGAAWMSLALQAHLRGWVAHAMGGFDKERAAVELALPEGHQLHAVVAIGRQGPVEALPESYRPREVPSGRVPLDQIARQGGF